jgi:universal stress protein E
MNMLNNILAPVDFSAASHTALLQAARLASLSGAKLHVLHVVESDSVAAMAGLRGGNVDHHAQEVVEEARSVIPHWLEGCKLPGGYETNVVAGKPLHVILEQVDSLHADLLVAGFTGKHGFIWGAGSVSARLARKAPIPTLLVRAEQPQTFQRIVACVDFSDASREVIRQARQLAAQDGAHVDFLHVWREPWVVLPRGSIFADAEPPAIIFTEKERLAYMENLRHQLHELVREEAPGIMHAEVLREAMSHGAGILDHARESRADLVVIGGTGNTSLRHMLLGSTAEQILAHSTCSLLVIKTPGG